MDMRIYFVGSHSTGKTTLARWVSKEYNLPLLSEVARVVLSERELTLKIVSANLDIADEYQLEIFNRQIELEEKAGDNFVSDRAFDNLAYAAEHSRFLEKINPPSNERLNSYMDRLKSGIIFFVRPQKGFVSEDGVRVHVDWDSIVRIDGMIKFILEFYSIKYVPISSSNTLERARLITHVIEAAKW